MKTTKIELTRDEFATAYKRIAEIRRVLAGEALSSRREEDLRRLREVAIEVGLPIGGACSGMLLANLIDDGHDLASLAIEIAF